VFLWAAKASLSLELWGFKKYPYGRHSSEKAISSLANATNGNYRDLLGRSSLFHPKCSIMVNRGLFFLHFCHCPVGSISVWTFSYLPTKRVFSCFLAPNLFCRLERRRRKRIEDAASRRCTSHSYFGVNSPEKANLLDISYCEEQYLAILLKATFASLTYNLQLCFCFCATRHLI